MDRLADKLHLKKNDKVLDIGCGWGSWVGILIQILVAVKGISLSEEQINFV